MQAARLPPQCTLSRCEACDDFLEARVAAQGIPPRHQFQVAIAYAAWKLARAGKLFAGEIVIANPGSDSSQAHDHRRTAACILFHGKKLNAAATLAQRFLFPPKTGVDQAKYA